MTGIPHSGSQCRKCGQTIFWHRSRTGKPYPCDSPTDRRAFHQCGDPAPKPVSSPKPAPAPKPTTPDFDPEPSLEQRVHDLEQIVGNLTGNRPVTNADLVPGAIAGGAAAAVAAPTVVSSLVAGSPVLRALAKWGLGASQVGAGVAAEEEIRKYIRKQLGAK